MRCELEHSQRHQRTRPKQHRDAANPPIESPSATTIKTLQQQQQGMHKKDATNPECMVVLPCCPTHLQWPHTRRNISNTSGCGLVGSRSTLHHIPSSNPSSSHCPDQQSPVMHSHTQQPGFGTTQLAVRQPWHCTAAALQAAQPPPHRLLVCRASTRGLREPQGGARAPGVGASIMCSMAAGSS